MTLLGMAGIATFVAARRRRRGAVEQGATLDIDAPVVEMMGRL
jgi:hypothetical protein